MRWTEKWLNCDSKSLVISERKSIWMPSPYRAPQGSVLSQCCLTISLMTWTIGQSTSSGIKLGENVNTIDACAAIQRDLNRQEKQAIDASFQQRRWEVSWLPLGRMLPASWPLVRPPLQCCVHLWGLQYKEDTAIPEWVHWLTMKTVEWIFRDWSV